MLRTLIVEGRRGVSTRKVFVEVRRRGEIADGYTDDRGRFDFDWPYDWIDSVTVEGEVVKRDWGFNGAKTELKVEFGGAAPTGYEIKLRYRGGGLPPAGTEVSFCRRNEEATSSLDRDGRCTIDWPHGWVDELRVDGELIKRDWELKARDRILELEIDDPRKADISASRGQSRYDTEGVRGQLFFDDGTRAFGVSEVAIEFAAAGLSSVYSTKDSQRSTVDRQGRFYLAGVRYAREGEIKQIWADGQPVRKGHWFRNEDLYYYVVLPDSGFGRHGDGGGLILGRVLDESGGGIYGCKVSAETAGGSMFGGGALATTTTDKDGRFALAFEGGTSVKQLMIDGDTPATIGVGRPGDKQQIPNKNVPAGTFGAQIVRRRKGWGSGSRI